jgi:hypothetical protein
MTLRGQPYAAAALRLRTHPQVSDSLFHDEALRGRGRHDYPQTDHEAAALDDSKWDGCMSGQYGSEAAAPAHTVCYDMNYQRNVSPPHDYPTSR